MNKYADRENSRKNFLIALGTTALTGCASASGLVPVRKKPETICGPQPLSVRRTQTTCTGGGDGGSLPSDLSGMTLAQIQAITTGQMFDLDDTQLASLTDIQLAAFTATQSNIFHPYQADALFRRMAAAQSKASTPPPSVTNPPPPKYTPPYAGSAFWGIVGGAIGGLVGGWVGATAGPASAVYEGNLGALFLGGLWGSGSDAYFNFWNPSAGQWQSIDISPDATESALLSTDSQGYTISGDYDSSSNTVTVTLIPN